MAEKATGEEGFPHFVCENLQMLKYVYIVVVKICWQLSHRLLPMKDFSLKTDRLLRDSKIFISHVKLHCSIRLEWQMLL